MPEPAPPFRHAFRVRYSEVDFQGLVYFAHYATYCDVAIHEFFRALPYDYTAIRARTGTDFNIVRALIEYRRPLRFDEAFEVEVRLGRIGRTSLTFTPALIPAGEAEPCATAEMVWVHADQATMRAAPLPAPLLALLERTRI
ncbi:MAG TPA: thioesterase family protein [Geminicoccaceae bacterium]|nr:thioesterase family protein [Geminicoccaceae bacterium]